MSDRIVKQKLAQEGEEIRLEARQLLGVASGNLAPAAAAALGLDDPPPNLPKQPPAAAKGESALDRAQAAAAQLLSQADDDAQAILAQAQSDVEQLHAKAATEIAQLKQTAERELEQQRAAIANETQSRLEQEYRERYLIAMQALEAAAADLAARREEYLAEIELPAFELIIALARQLMLTELNAAPETLGPVIAQALCLLKPNEQVTVEVHPAVFQRLTMDDTLQQALLETGVQLDLVDLAIGEGLQPGQFFTRLNGAKLSYDLEHVLSAMAELFRQRAQHLNPEALD